MPNGAFKLVAINRNRRSRSIVAGGRNHRYAHSQADAALRPDRQIEHFGPGKSLWGTLAQVPNAGLTNAAVRHLNRGGRGLRSHALYLNFERF